MEEIEKKKEKEKEIVKLEKLEKEVQEKIHLLKRTCAVEIHSNVNHIYMPVAVQYIHKSHIKDKGYLIRVRPHNCNVKLSFGGIDINILNREISCAIDMDYPMAHTFEIFMEPIDATKEHNIELTYTDSQEFLHFGTIRDVTNNDDVLTKIIQTGNLFGLTDWKLPEPEPVV